MTAFKPSDYPTVSASLTVEGADAAIEFYKTHLGATERMRLPMPGGKVAHAELQIGESVIMLADANPQWGNKAPSPSDSSAMSLAVYVPDVDATFAAMVADGATVVRPVETQFYGDRSGQVKDPFGHVWSVATHVEDVSNEEVARRAAAMFGGG